MQMTQRHVVETSLPRLHDTRPPPAMECKAFYAFSSFLKNTFNMVVIDAGASCL